MYGKILIKCRLKVLTGMHIGGSSGFSAIGAVDSPVIRDSLTGQPMLPGSSLKGKMRTLLAKAIKNHYITQECKDDPQVLKRLFGSAGDNRRGENPKTARLQFTDAFLVNAEELRRHGGFTEVKFENTIGRLTAVANPRQIERVVRSSEFAVRMVYDMEDAEDVREDFANIARGLKLLSMDYLGGHGSRGYGRVALDSFEVTLKDGECPLEMETLLTILKEVEDYGVYPIQA